MKKIITTLILAFSLIACSSTNNAEVNFIDITSFDVDMSGYENMNATHHHFRGIFPDEMLRVIEEGGSAVFYIGYTGCGNCQSTVSVIEEAASEVDATIYYVDAYSENYEFFDYYEDVLRGLDSILRHEDGSAVIYTPHIFAVVNGEFATSLIGGGFSEEEIVSLINEVYHD